mmetsp:Transcript_8040/g.17981  ORF Transcript_8040/g.17981 Transcript_8040/m.17981 type:complete len:357 (+) Transcript_8040:80-1150(+)
MFAMQPAVEEAGTSNCDTMSVGSRPSSRDTGGTGTAAQEEKNVYERRLAWLEEDLGVLHTRVRDSLERASGDGTGNGSRSSAMQSLVEKLMQELQEERRWRTELEGQVSQIEELLKQERAHRERAVAATFNEIEDVIKELSSRVEQGVASATNALNERASKTEATLKDLMTTVEAGLNTSTESLRRQAEKARREQEAWETSSHQSASSRGPGPIKSSRGVSPVSRRAEGENVVKEAEQSVLKVFKELSEENQRLRDAHDQLIKRRFTSGQNSPALSTASSRRASTPLDSSIRSHAVAGGATSATQQGRSLIPATIRSAVAGQEQLGMTGSARTSATAPSARPGSTGLRQQPNTWRS